MVCEIIKPKYQGEKLSIEEQKLILLASTLIQFDETNYLHQKLLLTVRNHISNFISKKTLNILDATHSLKDHNQILKKDLYEAVGFQNGFKPWTDARAIGIMGLNLVKNFFYRVEVFYLDAKKAVERNKSSKVTSN